MTASGPWTTPSMMPLLRLALFCLAAGASACAMFGGQGGAALPAELDSAAYRLGIGDKVRISVFGEPDLTVDAVIDSVGQISYPLLGSVPAFRKTADELAQVITAGLANGFLRKPDVQVTVVQYRPFYVIGQVKRAGAYAYSVGLTVEKALALAGGLTNLASTRRIYVLREDAPTESRIRVDLDTLVLPGDTVLVEEGLF